MLLEICSFPLSFEPTESAERDLALPNWAVKIQRRDYDETQGIRPSLEWSEIQYYILEYWEVCGEIRIPWINPVNLEDLGNEQISMSR